MNKRFIIEFVFVGGIIGYYNEEDFIFAEIDGEAWDEYGNDHSTLIPFSDEMSILSLDKEELEKLFPE